MIFVMIKYVCVVFHKDARGKQLPPTFVYLSVNMFMFNKTIVLFHHFFHTGRNYILLLSRRQDSSKV